MSAAYLLLLVLFTAAASAQDLTGASSAQDRTGASPAQDLSAPLPLDPAVRTGTLPNGLTYFIRRNAQPEARALLRLAVKAGSIDEADDQRGLAHLLEHMAFNGSTHFKSGELVKYLESIGSRFGADVNAYTSFDETVYMLEVPTDREGLLARLGEAGISARRGIMATHRQPAYAGSAHAPLPVTERLTDTTLILPLFHQLTDSEQSRVLDVLAR